MAEDLFDEVSAVMTTDTAASGCPHCGQAVETRLLQVDMSEFHGKLVQQTRCAAGCGYSAAVTVPSATLDYLGGHFELKLSEESDWRQRELIKSTTAIYSIPEIGLESARAGSCAKLTVLELLMATRMELGKAPSFDSGEDHADSMLKLSEFIERLDDIITGSLEATLILQDPRQKMCFIEKRLNADGEDAFYTTTPSNLVP